MGTRLSYGFTIIETMLFLAVTGLLVLGVLVGTGTALNNQRYRDSVESFKLLLQDQYAELGSVRNDRENTWSCDPSSAVATPGGTTIRGQSNCLIVGKYMQIRGGDVKIYPVLAVKTGSTTDLADIDALDSAYTYYASRDGIEDTALEWHTQIAWPKSGAGSKSPTYPRSISFLFIRSPESGGIYTFSSDNTPDEDSINQGTFNEIIQSGNVIPGQSSRRMCVLSSGLFPTGDMAVYLNPYAASGSAVEIQSAELMKTSGVACS